MHKIRQLLLMTALMSTFPILAYAQNYSSYVEHDWRFNIRGNSYGLVQRVFGPPARRTTTIYFAGNTFTTKLRAPCVIAFTVVSFGAAGLFLLTRQRGKSES